MFSTSAFVSPLPFFSQRIRRFKIENLRQSLLRLRLRLVHYARPSHLHGLAAVGTKSREDQKDVERLNLFHGNLDGFRIYLWHYWRESLLVGNRAVQ